MIYVNGQITHIEEGQISALDLGLMRGFGVFEHLITYEKKPFKLREHLLRLFQSANAIELNISKRFEEIEAIILEMIEKLRPENEISIRIVVTAGISDDYFNEKGKESLIIIMAPFERLPTTLYERGVDLIVTKHKRFFPEAKSLNYLPAILAMKEAKRLGAFDALYLSDQNEILEATTSNFFAIKGNTLITPSEGILRGITRDIVLSLAEGHFAIEERPISLYETIDEAFLTSTTKEILPIRTLEGRALIVGEKSAYLMKLFQDQKSMRPSMVSP